MKKVIKIKVNLEDLSYGQLFALRGKKAAIRSGLFILIFGAGMYILTGEKLSPFGACAFFLLDASIATWKPKIMKAIRKDKKD
tara:strand:- start:157 stop:405 length:249 start_codon:yes stop_codon:yes gene_type:complete